MIEEEIEVQAADGSAGSFLLRPDGDGQHPGVLSLTDIGGIRPSSLALARRVAALGYTVLVPNVFYRTARPPLWAWQRNMAEERSKQRFAELAKPLNGEAQGRDGAAYVDFLAAHPAVRDGKMAAIGYCFTGGMALRTAAERPERIAAAASFHGGGLWTEAPTSPHLVLPKVKARLYFGHAEEDHSMPASAIEQLDRALAAWGGEFVSEVYAGAHHGWTLDDGAAYDAAQAERAFARLEELLARSLS
jgi:carboxymethylenebutenolidase